MSKLLPTKRSGLSLNLSLNGSQNSLSRSVSNSGQWISSMLTSLSPTRKQLDKDIDLGTPHNRDKDITGIQLPAVSRNESRSRGPSRRQSLVRQPENHSIPKQNQTKPRVQSDSESEAISDISDDEMPLKKTVSKTKVARSTQNMSTVKPVGGLIEPREDLAAFSSSQLPSKPISKESQTLPTSSPKNTTASSNSLNLSSSEGLNYGLANPPPRVPAYETFGTSVSVKRTEMKVDEIKSIIEQQEMKLARYGKLIEAADTRIRDHMDHTELNERSILQKLTFEKDSLIDELKSERKTFNATIADAVRELKIAQQIQKDQQNRFLEAQQEIIALTERHQPVVVQQPILQKSPEPQEPCKSCKDLEAEIKSLKLEIEKVSKEATETAKQLLAEKESNATLTDHIAEIQTLTQTQSDTIQCLTSASSELEMHLKECILSIESLSKKKEKSDSVAKKLSEENQSLRDDLEHLETTLQRKKMWISENKRHIDDYRTSLSAAGLLDLMKVKVGGKTQGLSHCTLEDFIFSTLKEIHDLRKQLQRYQALESEQAFQLESYKEEISKQNEVIAMSKIHLDSSVAMAEGLRSERDYAISKIKDTVKVCKSRENQFQMELEIREKGVLEVVETSNQNLKAVREGYEMERAKFKEEIKDLLRENMALEANLRAVTKENKELTIEFAAMKKKLEYKHTEYLREIGIPI